MNIQFKFRGKFYSLCLGRITPWFQQIFLVSLTEEEYAERGKVVSAKFIWGIFPE